MYRFRIDGSLYSNIRSNRDGNLPDSCRRSTGRARIIDCSGVANSQYRHSRVASNSFSLLVSISREITHRNIVRFVSKESSTQ